MWGRTVQSFDTVCTGSVRGSLFVDVVAHCYEMVAPYLKMWWFTVSRYCDAVFGDGGSLFEDIVAQFLEMVAHHLKVWGFSVSRYWGSLIEDVAVHCL
jgi:hypothetical protein